jgi:hypothetical protein
MDERRDGELRYQGERELYKPGSRPTVRPSTVCSHFDNQNSTTPAHVRRGDFPDFRAEWNETSLSRSGTPRSTCRPRMELAGILAGILEQAGVEIRYSAPPSSGDR